MCTMQLIYIYSSEHRSVQLILHLYSVYPSRSPFESSILSKISCVLGEQDKHYSKTGILVGAICFIHHRGTEREGASEPERESSSPLSSQV